MVKAVQYIKEGQRVLLSDIFRNVAGGRRNIMHLDLSSHKFSEVLWYSVGHWFCHMLLHYSILVGDQDITRRLRGAP